MVDSDFKDILKSVVVASMGLCSVLLISLGLSYASEIAHPIKTAIPHFAMILGSTLIFLVVYKRTDMYQLVPVTISAVSVLYLHDHSVVETQREDYLTPHVGSNSDVLLFAKDPSEVLLPKDV